jgi:hypothetical protein
MQTKGGNTNTAMPGDADEGRKHQHSHTGGGEYTEKEEKPIDNARCELNAAITR